MYRDEPDLFVRVHELETELAEKKERVETLEKELYALRREVQAAQRLAERRRVFRISWTAVKGIVLGALGGGVPAFIEGNPYFILGGVGFGLFFAFIVRQTWDPPDDFPPAPGARLGL